jgi:oxygen-independent coproporphyrinogen III oxidase
MHLAPHPDTLWNLSLQTLWAEGRAQLQAHDKPNSQTHVQPNIQSPAQTQVQKPVVGIYIHVPFCPHICTYCDFVKTSRFNQSGLKLFWEGVLLQYQNFRDSYLTWARAFSEINVKPPATLYFGGGTPGLFPGHWFKPVVDAIKQDWKLLEFTVETNPYSNKQGHLESYFELGCNRVTLGAQSLCPDTLVFLSRKHTVQNVIGNLNFLSLKFPEKQVQVDLIYGLKKGVRRLSVDNEVRRLFDLGATGISSYALTLEKGTLFGSTQNADDNVAFEEYRLILDSCKDVGFKHVETSNFSRNTPLHNSIYWTGFPYLGLGTGAHGLTPPSQEYGPFGRRYHVGPGQSTQGLGLELGNHSLPFHDPQNSLFDIQWESKRNLNDALAEGVFTFLRLEHGIPWWWMELWAGKGAKEKILKSAKVARGVDEKMILTKQGEIVLSATEKLRGDAWAVEILAALES